MGGEGEERGGEGEEVEVEEEEVDASLFVPNLFRFHTCDSWSLCWSA